MRSFWGSDLARLGADLVILGCGPDRAILGVILGGQNGVIFGVIFGVRNEVILGSISGWFWPKRGWPFLGGQILALGVRFWS